MTFIEIMKKGTSRIYDKAKTYATSPETKKGASAVGDFFQKIGQNARDNDFGSPYGKGGFSTNQPKVSFQPNTFSPLTQSPKGYEYQAPLKVDKVKPFYQSNNKKRNVKYERNQKIINITVR